MGAVRFLDPISVIEPCKLCLPRTRASAAFQHLLYLIARLGSDSRHPNVARLFFDPISVIEPRKLCLPKTCAHLCRNVG